MVNPDMIRPAEIYSWMHREPFMIPSVCGICCDYCLNTVRAGMPMSTLKDFSIIARHNAEVVAETKEERDRYRRALEWIATWGNNSLRGFHPDDAARELQQHAEKTLKGELGAEADA